MDHQHSPAIGFCIPTGLRVILQEEKFIPVSRIINDVGIAIVGHRLHARHFSSFSQFDRLQPSAEPFLIARVIARHIAITIIRTIVHQRPSCHAEIIIIAVDIIKIGQTQTMGEFMTHRTNTTCCSICIQLWSASIGVNIDAVHLYHTTSSIRRIAQIPGMRPYQIFLRIVVMLSLASINHIDLIHLTVMVPVVIGKIYLWILLVDQKYGLFYHDIWILVIINSIVLSIIAIIFGDSDGTHHIERQVKLPSTLCMEIVFHTSHKLTIRKTYLIRHSVEENRIIGSLEGLVSKVHQNHKTPLVTEKPARHTEFPLLDTAHRTAGFSGLCLRSECFHIRFLIFVVYQLIAPAISCKPSPHMFIAS